MYGRVLLLYIVVVYAGYRWLWDAVCGMACGAGPQLLVSRFLGV
jgi:hypothetical protein